jgi:uncharacterized protein GlcG (DUF336 family)
MEGAFLAGIDLSLGKARSALRFEEPTAKIEAAVHDGRYALVTAGAVEMQGGIPLLRGSEILGAIGVSYDFWLVVRRFMLHLGLSIND